MYKQIHYTNIYLYVYTNTFMYICNYPLALTSLNVYFFHWTEKNIVLAEVEKQTNEK